MGGGGASGSLFHQGVEDLGTGDSLPGTLGEGFLPVSEMSQCPAWSVQVFGAGLDSGSQEGQLHSAPPGQVKLPGGRAVGEAVWGL